MLTPDDMTALDLAQAHELYLADEDATTALGRLVAPHLKPGDVVYLHGDLGMGKSSLARSIIRTLTNPSQDVPSPTFTLIQTYDTDRFELLHLDLYRLKTPDEAYELGLDDAQSHAVLVIEWPDRLGHLGFDDRLDIGLEVPPKDKRTNTNLPTGTGGRIARLNPRGRFGDR